MMMTNIRFLSLPYLPQTTNIYSVYGDQCGLRNFSKVKTMEARGFLFVTSVLSIAIIHLKTVVSDRCTVDSRLFLDPPPKFPDFMDAFRNTISRIGIENLRPPDGRESSSNSSCPKSVNWTEFNSRLCAGDPFDLDGFCESLSATSDPDDATSSSIDDSRMSITILPDDDDHRRQTSIFISSSSDVHSTQRVENFTTGSSDTGTPPSTVFFPSYTAPANDCASSTASALGRYDGGGVNVPMVVACVLIGICFFSIIVIILFTSRARVHAL